MFQIIVFSKPVEEMGEILVETAKEAAFMANYGGPAVEQELVSLEDVLLQNNATPKHKIMIRHYPGFAPKHTHFAFVGEEFTRKGLEDAYMCYVGRPAGLIDRTDPAQLMGAVMGHYYGVVDIDRRGQPRGHADDWHVSILVKGVGILNDMLVIKAAIDKEA